MLGSLRARLIVSFSVVVALAVFLAGAGSLFLLRDQQQATALERYGHVVDPLAVRVTAMLDHRETLASIKDYLRTASNDSGVRVLLLDQDLLVVFDSEDKLLGKYVLTFDTFNPRHVD